MAAAPAAFGAPAGARDREGAARRNWHGWMALSQGFIHIVFFLIIAAPQVTNFVPFSGSLLYGNATRLQADDGSDRGHARVLLRWAEVLVGSGDRRRRASSARGPSPTSFGVLGLTRARQSIFWPGNKGGWRGGGKRVVEVVTAVRATHPTLHFLRMRARARHTGDVASMARPREADGWQEQQREGCL